jgi:hypothetical protein
MDDLHDRHHEDADDMHEAEIMSRFKARSRMSVNESQGKPKVTKIKDFLFKESVVLRPTIYLSALRHGLICIFCLFQSCSLGTNYSAMSKPQSLSAEDSAGAIDPQELADISRTVQVEITQQVRPSTDILLLDII